MCRLCASLNRVDEVTKYLFAQLLELASDGNDHGTGIASDGAFCKSGDPADLFFMDESVLGWYSNLTGSYIAGHVRLASVRFRLIAQSTEHAHPHVFPKDEPRYWVMHNGNFKDVDRLATELGIVTATKENPNGFTDSMVFTKLLENKLSGAAPTLEKIVEALSEVGEADYSLLVGGKDMPLYIIRGNRPLHLLHTNYGLFLCTDQDVLKKMSFECNVPLRILANLPKLEPQKFEALDPWTAYSFDGSLSAAIDISRLKKVSEKETKATIVVGDIPAKNALCHEIEQLMFNNNCTYREIELMFEDVIGQPVVWRNLDTATIEAVLDALKTALASESYSPTPYKKSVWDSVKESAVNTPDAYVLASMLSGGDFGVPWFINEVELFKAIEENLK